MGSSQNSVASGLSRPQEPRQIAQDRGNLLLDHSGPDPSPLSPKSYRGTPEDSIPPALDDPELQRLESEQSADELHTLTRAFKRSHQLTTILWQGLIKWAFTTAVLLFIFMTLKLFEHKRSSGQGSRHLFNLIMTALNILLALNFFSALKDFTKLLRWRILATNAHSAYEIDLILSCDSVTNLCKLAWHYTLILLDNLRPDRTSEEILLVEAPRSSHGHVSRLHGRRSNCRVFFSLIKVLGWICLNFVAQAGIAIIGLNYSIDEAGILIPAPLGATQQPLIEYYYPLNVNNRKDPLSTSSQQSIAHQLGQLGGVFNATDIASVGNLSYAQALFNNGPTTYYYTNVNSLTGEYQEYTYEFFDSNLDVNSNRIFIPAGRSISTRANNCRQYQVVDGAGGSQSESTITWIDDTDMADPIQSTLNIDLTGAGATTFIWRSENAACIPAAPRCGAIWAFQQPNAANPAALFRCEVSVDHVLGNTGTEAAGARDLHDTTAGYAAVSAALTGFGSTQTIFVNGSDSDYQFHRFDNESYWTLDRPNLLSAYQVGDLLAEYAISSIAAMAWYSPGLSNPRAPMAVTGAMFTVEWVNVYAIFSVIAAVYLTFLMAAAVLANSVVIRDDSNLANAVFLRKWLGKMSRDETLASYLTGEEIAERIDAQVEDGLVYAAEEHPRRLSGVESVGGTYSLGLRKADVSLAVDGEGGGTGEKIGVRRRMRQRRLGRRHRNGLYV